MLPRRLVGEDAALLLGESKSERDAVSICSDGSLLLNSRKRLTVPTGMSLSSLSCMAN